MNQLIEQLTNITLAYIDPENQPPQWPLSEMPRLVEDATKRYASRVVSGEGRLPGEVGRISIAIEPSTFVDTQDVIAWDNWCEAQCEKGASLFIALGKEEE